MVFGAGLDLAFQGANLKVKPSQARRPTKGCDE